MMHENYRGGLKDLNVNNKFKRETHKKGEESATMILLNTKKNFTKGKYPSGKCDHKATSMFSIAQHTKKNC